MLFDTDAERVAHTAHLADLVLAHDVAQHLPWHVTETMLAVARRDPGIDLDAADRLVHQALAAVVTVEILAGREAAR